MNSLNFDEGYTELAINGDESRILRLNLADSDLIVRFYDAMNELEKIATEVNEIKLRNDGSAKDFEKIEILKDLTNKVREKIDYALNTNACEIAFGNQSPLSLVKGKYLFEGFLDALKPFIEKEIKKQSELSKKRIEKYTKRVK